MIGLPLLLGIAVTSAIHNTKFGESSFVKVACVFLVSVLFVVHWSRFSYREDRWWNTNELMRSVPEFNFIATSPDRANFIRHMQQTLGQETQGKRTLIISGIPSVVLRPKYNP